MLAKLKSQEKIVGLGDKTLLFNLSFTHFAELMKIDDPLKRLFYHRFLKCNVLLELKLRKFKHGDMAQLNTYLNYYKKNEMTGGDKPPIGILLCTEKDRTLVEYVLAGIDNNLFVSEYSLQLPSKKEMERFLEKELQKEN
ncbi:MAG: PDDEXK nuclease domain-containing protein [Gammaproteobacteria bacterium]